MTNIEMPRWLSEYFAARAQSAVRNSAETIVDVAPRKRPAKSAAVLTDSACRCPPELDCSQPAAAAILDADSPASNASAIPRRWVIRRECAGQNDREKIALSRRATAGREFRRGR